MRSDNRISYRRGSQVVRSGSAKPLFAGSIPAPASFTCARFWWTTRMVVRRFGSIDSLAPAISPLTGLRPCRSAPAGSIPASRLIHLQAVLVDNEMVVQRFGSIDSLAPAISPLTGFRPCRSAPTSSIPRLFSRSSGFARQICFSDRATRRKFVRPKRVPILVHDQLPSSSHSNQSVISVRSKFSERSVRPVTP